MKKLFAILVFFVFQMICSDIYGKEVPTTKSYYVIDGFCCGGDDSDPHAVFGIEASDGYILLGKSLDINSKEDGFAVKIRKNLPNEKLFLHPEEENTYDWSIVTGEKGKRDGFNAAAIIDNHILTNSRNQISVKLFLFVKFGEKIGRGKKHLREKRVC